MTDGRTLTTQPSGRNVSFTVLGIPQPAGSKKAFRHRATGRIVVTDDAKGSRPWKNTVAAEAAIAMQGRELLEGPLALALTFVVPRPKGHLGTGRNTGRLRSSAPYHPAVKPDITKLVRAVEDACTGIVWRDDAQIVRQQAVKTYGTPARCIVEVERMAGTL